MNQIVTVTFFRFKTLKSKFWAFKMMGLGHTRLKKVEGLSFYKLMGTGGGEGFSWKPDFSTYCLFCVWDREELAHRFISTNKLYEQYETQSVEKLTFWLKPVMVHGLWSGQQPFAVSKPNMDLPVAVLTRATIHLKHVPAFWRKVAPASNSITEAKGKLFTKGVGEWPLFQQATISIWESMESMKHYAYHSKAHKEIIKLTRQEGWYKEEMFARFQLYHTEGTWQGKDPIESYTASSTTV